MLPEDIVDAHWGGAAADIGPRTVVVDMIREHLSRGEGRANHFYLCSNGFVTIGIGCMIPDLETALALPLVDIDSGNYAQPEQVESDFILVLQQAANRKASHYKKYTTTILPEEAIDLLFDYRSEEFSEQLQRAFPDFYRFPGSAQLGLMDMAFNLGTAKLLRWPNFCRGVRTNDWLLCAAECRRRPPVSEARNRKTRALFEAAAT
jgi:GH24 family phage-related lysozyme (muramidase)